MGAECIGMDYLAMILGTEVGTDGAITITSDIIVKSYVLGGTFKGRKQGDNTEQVFDIILYNVSPQPNADITLDATAIGSYDLAMNVLQDDNKKVATIRPHVEAPAV